MKAPVSDPQCSQHRMSDWLALHELDPATCGQILDAIAREFDDVAAEQEGAGSRGQSPDLQAAWLQVIAAMREFLPERQPFINDTFARAERIVVDRPGSSRKAVTLDNGPDAYPTILFTWRGEPAEHLVIAHEFAHAVQIRASQGRPVPPIMREICAFLGEHALLLHAQRRHAAQHAGLARAWRRDSRRYFGVQSDRLRAALAAPTLPYVYSWNYPMARYLAVRIFKQCSPDLIWGIFAGRTSIRHVLQELA